MHDPRPSKASILAALSQALDLVEGQPEGHALRTCRFMLRLADELGMTQTERENLFFAGVLKDSGCSNNSVRVQKIFGGDEHIAKFKVKFINWSSSLESAKFTFQEAEKGKGLVKKLRRLSMNIGTPAQLMNEVTKARCTRGAEIARHLGLHVDVGSAIQYLDEHWDGKGAPYGKRHQEIPLLARILCLGQTFEVFLTTYGLDAAMDVIQERSKSWFDPDLVQATLSFRGDHEFWDGMSEATLPGFAESALPWITDSALEADIDRVCEAFAMIIDAKSSFTSEHSTRVTSYSVELAKYFGMSEEQVQTIRRAGLLHDIGKLGVPTSILEKPAKLDDGEFERVKLHPKFSHIILSRIPSFESIAEIASAHHERLDGKGYWRGLTGDQLPLEVRIVTAGDVFDALTAKRPYRDAMPVETALGIMEKDAGAAFDPDCLKGLWETQAVEIAAAA